MSSLTVEFKFQIGELVYVRGSMYGEGRRPRQFVILERIAQECPVGVQLQYKLHDVAGFMLEIALTRDEPPYRPETDAWLADRLRVMKAEREIVTTEREAADLRWYSRLKKEHKKPDALPETPE